MKALLLKHLYGIQSSYWFVPLLMSIGSILLSLLTIEIDERISTDWPEHFSWIYSNKPDGARALLATVAGSMITVAGVTFSLTLLAVSHTTSQFGPRLLTNFMRDRGNQITLGTFLATFLYCLLVLRTVRTAEEAQEGVQSEELFGAFVPHLSITVAIALTLCSVGVLIYFFHHIPETMNLSNVVSTLGRQLTSSADEMFPEMIGESAPDDADAPHDQIPDESAGRSVSIGDGREGYLQTMDDEGLLHLSREHGLIISLHCRPGDFLCRNAKGFTIWPAGKDDDGMDEELQACFAFGVTRTPQQNLLFIVDQLVEVAARALSPGINDPFTANICMHWLHNSLTVIGARNDPKPYRYDSDGNLRIIANPLTFAEVCDRVFDQLCPYFAADRNAALVMMTSLQTLCETLTDESRRTLMRKHARRLFASFQLTPAAEHDLETLRKAAGNLLSQDDK